jgi:hypothetical protein
MELKIHLRNIMRGSAEFFKCRNVSRYSKCLETTDVHGEDYTNFLSRLLAGQYSAYSSQVQPAVLRQHSSVMEGFGPRFRCRLRSLRNTRASTTLRNGYPATIHKETSVR